MPPDDIKNLPQTAGEVNAQNLLDHAAELKSTHTDPERRTDSHTRALVSVCTTLASICVAIDQIKEKLSNECEEEAMIRGIKKIFTPQIMTWLRWCVLVLILAWTKSGTPTPAKQAIGGLITNAVHSITGGLTNNER